MRPGKQLFRVSGCRYAVFTEVQKKGPP